MKIKCHDSLSNVSPPYGGRGEINNQALSNYSHDRAAFHNRTQVRRQDVYEPERFKLTAE